MARSALALSGGGARIVYQATVLSRMEHDLGSPIIDHFDALFGTSCGAIMATMLANGHTAQQSLRLITELVGSIFAKPRLKSRLFAKNYYDRAVLVERGRELCPKPCGDLDAHVYIHAYDENVGSPVTFNSSDLNLAAVPLIELAIASSSAPTFFGPYFVEQLNKTFSDGGTTANNPSGRAITLGYDRVVSIGTGQRTRYHSNEQIAGWRGFQQALRVIPQAMDNAELAQLDAQSRLEDDFVHVDAELIDGVNDDMDDASTDQLEKLTYLAHRTCEMSREYQRALSLALKT